MLERYVNMLKSYLTQIVCWAFLDSPVGNVRGEVTNLAREQVYYGADSTIAEKYETFQCQSKGKPCKY